MRDLLELMHAYGDEALGLAVFILLIVWYVCDTIENICKNKNKKK